MGVGRCLASPEMERSGLRGAFPLNERSQGAFHSVEPS
jgi:hypothetical protein